MKDHESAGRDLAYLAECQLATLEDMRSKHTPKYALERQENIAKFSVGCAARYCTTEDILDAAGPRLSIAVKEYLAAQPKPPARQVTKVLFLDIDGPMIPRRAWFLQRPGTLAKTFDPIATAMVLDVLERSGAKIVISSTWTVYGPEAVASRLRAAGIDPALIHEDWTVRCQLEKREAQIEAWLKRHPEVDRWAVLDDGDLAIKNLVRVTVDDGMLVQHYHKLVSVLVDG